MVNKQGEKKIIQTLKTYECRIENYFKDDSALVSNHIASTPSQARYAFWQAHAEVLVPFNKCLTAIKTKSLGAVRPSQFYGPEEDFARMCEQRDIQFAYQGMVVDVAGKKGWLVGSNSSLNMDVLFEGYDHTSNCHPHHETTFYDNNMNIVRDFKKLKQAAQTVLTD